MAGGDGQGHQMNLVLLSPPADLKEGGPQIVICQVMPLEKHSQHGQTGAQTLNFSLARLVIGFAWRTAEVIQAFSVIGLQERQICGLWLSHGKPGWRALECKAVLGLETGEYKAPNAQAASSPNSS